MLERAGLDQVVTLPNHGWVGDGARHAGINREPSRGISVVVTVRNDREGLRELLPSLATQTEKPDEIVIVDGGSVDGTLDVLQGFRLPGTPIRTIRAPGANIAAGRNIGVREARHELIACTDAGCRPEPSWLASLHAGLEKADIVGGVFVADGQTEFERIVSLTHYPVPEELDRPSFFVRFSHRLFGRQYLASRAGGRSMGFHRDVWRATGGFPERQYAGEDQAFARSIVDSGFTVALAADAAVRWRPPGTWAANARMFYVYCRGDVRSKGRLRHVLRLVTWTAGPVAALRGRPAARVLIAVGAVAYIALPVRRAKLAGISHKAWWRIPVAVAVKDLAQIAGAAHGALDAARGVPQPTPNRAPAPTDPSLHDLSGARPQGRE
jgi:cellulose synthase/poly-beta-1,6-N-acetylglucosamine synthase-like glycosyltransferase